LAITQELIILATKLRIGHASTNNPASGLAADEVLISDFYSSLKPTVLLRPTSAELAEKSAAACEAGCNNNKIEYSQTSRGTLYTEAQKVNYNLANITTRCYADCSSFMTVCAIAGGANLEFSYMPNCGNMREVFVASGKYKALTADKYLNDSSYLQRGDILVRENYINGSRHTVMVLGNGSGVSASNTTLVSDLAVIKIAVDIVKISATKIDTLTKITKFENGKEVLFNDVGLYKWSYSISAVDNMEKNTSLKNFDIKSGVADLSLKSLTPGKSYVLKIYAKEITSSVEFCSPSIIFTTTPKATSDKTSRKLSKAEPLAKINNIYLKLKDTYKRVIIHNNT
jgi:hypothetical protein